MKNLKSKKKSIIFVAIAAFTALTSCKKDTPVTPVKAPTGFQTPKLVAAQDTTGGSEGPK